MMRASRTLFIFLISFFVVASTHAQQSQPVQIARLRPNAELRWQRVSPTVQQPDGPVLYQLLFNASGTPGTVPAFDANPRHLIDSPITISGGNVVIGGGSGLNVNGANGIMSFANGQTFPGSGLPSLAGEVTGPVGTTVVSNAVSTDTANAIVRRDGAGSFSAENIALDGILALPTTTSSSVGVLTLGGVLFLHNFGIQNTFVGTSAGNLSMTAQGNAAFGYGALTSITTGFGNSSFGSTALASNTTGSINSAFGRAALTLNTTGSSNSAFGKNALNFNTTGSSNSAFGYDSLQFNSSASNNSAFGVFALAANSEGENNAAFGNNVLSFNSTGSHNAAFGYNALHSNTTASNNAAFGDSALVSNTTGSFNAAFGTSALYSSTGNNNAAFGDSALYFNTGDSNDAFGSHALYANTTGFNNATFGDSALVSNTTGFNNTAVGVSALGLLLTGHSNIAIGGSAGANLTSGESNNIDIGNFGVVGDSNTIRIGGTQTTTFVAGISGATSASGINVLVNSLGQLGTTTSSRRFKQDIADLGAESDILMKLRPVAFYYKPELDNTHTRQYGLVAEEVAQVAPGLVVFDSDGEPQTVRYHFVNAMLLNEVQKQRRLVEAQHQENQKQEQIAEDAQQQIVAQKHEMQAMKQQMEVLGQQNSEMQLQMKAVLLRLAAVEKSGQQNNPREAALNFTRPR